MKNLKMKVLQKGSTNVQEKLKKHIHVETGIFGAEMKVELINDGPVTIMLEK